MPRPLTALAALALALAASALPAQRLTADLRGAMAVPTQDFADADFDLGFGFGATLAYRFQTHVHVYGGWDRMRFPAPQSFAGTDTDFEETGYTLGLRFEHALGDAWPLWYRLEAGATFKHIEIEDADGDRIADSGHGTGLEVGVGLLVPLGASWRFAPTLRWRTLEREFTIANVTTRSDLTYGALELGLSRRF
jgi:hypothetical protein